MIKRPVGEVWHNNVDTSGRDMRAVVLKIAGALILLVFLAPSLRQPVFAQEDPSGMWTPNFNEDWEERIPGPEIGDYLGVPINAAARLQGDSWDATLVEIPENQCREHGADYGWRGPSIRNLEGSGLKSQKVVAYHTHLRHTARSKRFRWMIVRSRRHYARAHMGGIFEGALGWRHPGRLNHHLKENWIRRNGIPEAIWGPHSTSCGTELPDGRRAYVRSRVSHGTFYPHDGFCVHPQAQMAPWPCESVDEVDQSRREVPAHLPGNNTFLDEFPAKYGIPPEAARGGAETMYPEYMQKMKDMKLLAAASGLSNERAR